MVYIVCCFAASTKKFRRTSIEVCRSLSLNSYLMFHQWTEFSALLCHRMKKRKRDFLPSTLFFMFSNSSQTSSISSNQTNVGYLLVSCGGSFVILMLFCKTDTGKYEAGNDVNIDGSHHLYLEILQSSRKLCSKRVIQLLLNAILQQHPLAILSRIVNHGFRPWPLALA